MLDITGSGPLPVALKLQREKTIAALCDHFSNDRLTVEEFEQRLDVANRALTVSDLQLLLADLPAPTAAPVPPAVPPLSQPAHVRGQQALVAIMGGVERRGMWVPAKRTYVLALMGGGLLDFREVQLPQGTTEVMIVALMGGVEVIVAPGMNVDTGGFAIMGGFAHRHDFPPANDPDAPLLRITGFALMGGVDLQVRLPGESARDANDRIREERRRRREERRGR